MGTDDLHIGIDARAAFLDPHRGLGRVARQLTEALLQTPSCEVTVFVPREVEAPEAWYRDRVTVVHLLRPVRGAFLWDGPAWRWTLPRHPLDVLYLPAWGVPPRVPVPVVSTLHDTIPIRFPDSIPSRRTRRRAVQRLGTHRRAALVHTNSKTTEDDAIRVLGIPSSRVRPVLLGVDRDRFFEDRTVRPEHLLYVGGADSHKRVSLLLNAWSRPDTGDLPPLVIAGSAASAPLARAAAAAAPRRIRLHPGVDDSVLRALYQAAVALLVPSLWEGFGLPVVEAMACGCPVVASRAGALMETAADAAVYLDPAAGELAWISSVRSLVADSDHRQALVERSLERSRVLSWARTAEGLREIFTEAASIPAARSDTIAPSSTPEGR